MRFSTTTAGNCTPFHIVITTRPLCPHPAIDIDCDAEHEELRVTCEQCRKSIALARSVVAADQTGEVTRGLVAAAFGQSWRKARFPWERLYRCHAVGFPVQTGVVWLPFLECLVRACCGNMTAWLWRYSILAEV